MSRYLRTNYNNEKVIMEIDGCDSCPLMKFNINDRVTYCKCFKDKYGINWIDLSIEYYSDNGIIREYIMIPKWCELPKNLNKLYDNNDFYTPIPNTVMITILQKIENKRLPIINTRNLKKRGDREMVNCLTKFIKIENNKKKRNNLNIKKEYKICSFCGEDDKSIKRHKNIGMCNDCWEINKYDKHKKHQSFINNFRLKRNKSFTNKTFKYIY